jgi:hypothetical protein
MNPIEEIYHTAQMQSILPSPVNSDDDGSTTSEEIDKDAPYGRKKNGEPYKTRPSLRNAMKKHHQNNKEKKNAYQKAYYEKHRDSCLKSVQKCQEKNKEKYREYYATYHQNMRNELQYYRDLFAEVLEEKV